MIAGRFPHVVLAQIPDQSRGRLIYENGRDRLHFARLASLENVADAHRALFPDTEVEAVVVSGSSLGESLSKLAQKLGIEVVELSSTKRGPPDNEPAAKVIVDQRHDFRRQP